jgi:hypothetical protein
MFCPGSATPSDYPRKGGFDAIIRLVLYVVPIINIYRRPSEKKTIFNVSFKSRGGQWRFTKEA